MGDINNNPDFTEDGTVPEEAKQTESETTPVVPSSDEETDSDTDSEATPEDAKKSSQAPKDSDEEQPDESPEDKGEEGTEQEETDDTISESEVMGLKKQKEKLDEEIKELRRQRRTLRGDETKAEPTRTVTPAVTPDLTQPGAEEELSPEDQAKIDNYLKKRGVVLKEDQQISIEEDELQAFLDKHPEYDNDDQWEEFKEESRYYSRPRGQSPAETRKWYRNVFTRIHRTLSGDIAPTSPERIGEQKSRIKKAGEGSGGGGSTTLPASPKKGVPPEMRQHLRGFSDEELDSM